MADEMNSTCTDKAQDQTEQAVPDADTARMADTMAEDATAEGATEADTACDAQAGAADDADENGKLRGSERRRLKRAEAELAEANKKLEQAKQELATERDKYLRMLAEYDNFRRRTAKEKEGIYTDACADAVRELLPIVDTLERAVGHVVGTSLPVGGSSTHAVLSAHSGMASSKLFSDIDQLAEGDMFYIHVLGYTLAYKVDAIHTVLPTDTSLLQIADGKDYVTLVTCTPFGVNTHRLLVRGQRVPYVPEQEAPAAAEKPVASSWTQHYLTGLGVGLGAVAVIGGAYFLVRRVRHA